MIPRLAVAVVLGLSCCAADAAEKRVLLVTGQDYPGHKWQETAPVLAEAIRADKRLDVVVTENPKDLASPELGQYDAIVLHFMNWEQPDPGLEARENLKRFVEGGKGLVLVHFACGAFQEWPEFRNLAGRSYDPKLRGHDPFGPFQVEIKDPAHPTMQGLKDFETTDELYTCLAGDAPVKVLATAKSKVDGLDYPMAFVRDYGKGRVFHSVLGHDAPSLKNPPVARLFRQATAWAAGLANEAETAGGAQLFNGKNLDGWYTFIKGRGRGVDPLGVFTVNDGMLRISGEELGCVTSNDEFENFHLVMEFKWGEKTWAGRTENARDSGLLVHSVGEDGAYGGIWMNSIECQMIEGGTGDVIVVGDGSDTYSVTAPAAAEKQGDCPVFQSGGSPATINTGRINWWGRDPGWKDVKGFRGQQDLEKPVGEWNRYECIADGSRLTLILNGVVVNECFDVRPSKGRIQIQSEGAEVFVRRVEVEPLPSLAAGQPVLLVLNKHENSMAFVDPTSLQVLTKIATGPNPHEIAMTKDQRFAYLSNYAAPGNTISVVDLVERRHVQQIGTGSYSRIHGAAMAPDGRHAYFTAGQTGYVVEVDTASNQVTRAIETQGKISHMVLPSPDGARLYTANIGTQNVSVIDTVSGNLIAQIPCGKGCEGMAFTPDGKQLWVLNQEEGSISIVDPAANAVVETVPCPGMPVRIKFTADGKLALIPSWSQQGELVVMDAVARKEVKRIPVGAQAIGIELSPDGTRAFVGCERLDGVHVVDMATLSVIGIVQTGDGSDAMAWKL